MFGDRLLADWLGRVLRRSHSCGSWFLLATVILALATPIGGKAEAHPPAVVAGQPRRIQPMGVTRVAALPRARLQTAQQQAAIVHRAPVIATQQPASLAQKAPASAILQLSGSGRSPNQTSTNVSPAAGQ